MLANPKRNQLVRVWYAKPIRDTMPYHGMVGTVAVACKGKPRNHGVLISVRGIIAIPCGNLHKLDVHLDHLIHTRRIRGGWMASVVGYRSWRPGHFVVGGHVPGDQAYAATTGHWHTVVGVMPTKGAAIELAQAGIEMRGEASLVPVPDARDRCRKTWWHHEAERRRNEVAQ